MRLIDEVQIVGGFKPVDMQTAANDADCVSLKNYRNCAVILYKGIGTAHQDPVLTFYQSKTVAGGDEKALATITGYHYKQGADLALIGEFSEATQAAGATVTLNATSAEAAGIYVFSIADSDLDDGFSCFRVSVADVGGNAQLGCLLYILSNPRHAGDPMVSAIVD